MAAIRDRRIPSTRHVEPDLRRRRLLAARRFAWGSVPRLAIMLGHWDSGDAVRLGLSLKEIADARQKRQRATRRKRPPRGREQ